MPRPAVIFDVDGTLVDTNWFHTVSWWRTFQKAAHDIPMSRIHPLIGMGSGQLVGELVGDGNDDLTDGHGKEFEAFMDEIVAFPRAGDLLRALHERDVKVALATSSQEAHLRPMLDAIAADDAIDEIVNADDVDRSKPDPDIFGAALEKLGNPPSDATLVIGDTRWDIEAAQRAGLRTACVLTGGNARHDLDAAGAVAVFEDVAQILASLDDSDGPVSRLLRQDD